MPGYLRVMPVGDHPVPVHDGRKHGWLRREGAPAEGHLVPDTLHNRRRILFGELTLLAEGDAALPRGAAAPASPALAAPPAKAAVSLAPKPEH
jgi:hypothetical protein